MMKTCQRCEKEHDTSGLLCEKCFSRAIRKKLNIRMKNMINYYRYLIKSKHGENKKRNSESVFVIQIFLYITSLIFLIFISSYLSSHVSEDLSFLIIIPVLTVILIPSYHGIRLLWELRINEGR